MAQLERKQGEGEGWSSDGWDGYPAGLQRILSQIADQKIENVVVIGGDIHSFWVTDLKQDFGDPNAPTVATEFVGTSVTSRACRMRQASPSRYRRASFFETISFSSSRVGPAMERKP
jgi:phosphodiesterase/alkaline phosphatase D-like protein